MALREEIDFLKEGYFKRYWQFLLPFQSLSSHSLWQLLLSTFVPLLSLDEQWCGLGLGFFWIVLGLEMKTVE